MHGNLIRLVAGGLVLSAPVLTSAVSRTDSLLENTAWLESIIMTSSDSSLSLDGIDDAAPEPLTASLVGAGYSLDSQVAFPQGGAPNVAVTLAAQHESGGPALIGALVGCRIDFQIRVLENALPPVPVTTVPVHIHAQGTAAATGDSTLRAASFSRFTLISVALLLSWDVSADNAGGGAPPSDSFNNDDQIEVTPNEVVSGEILVDASIGAESPEGAASSTEATFDPVIEIADVTIPGTSASFRDFFTVEFSPGYFALGQVPVERTTWGKIKRLYKS